MEALGCGEYARIALRIRKEIVGEVKEKQIDIFSVLGALEDVHPIAPSRCRVGAAVRESTDGVHKKEYLMSHDYFLFVLRNSSNIVAVSEGTIGWNEHYRTNEAL